MNYVVLKRTVILLCFSELLFQFVFVMFYLRLNYVDFVISSILSIPTVWFCLLFNVRSNHMFFVRRRKAAIDDIAVKPITQFPISLAEEVRLVFFTTTVFVFCSQTSIGKIHVKDILKLYGRITFLKNLSIVSKVKKCFILINRYS